MSPPRDSWKNSAGFLLATIGAAVGLGNLWRFSYIASQGGGAAFVLFYVVLALIIGVPLLTAEMVIGRGTRLSPIRALRQIGGAGWTWVAGMFIGVAGFVLSSYSIIIGWTGRLLIDTVRGAVPADTAGYFGRISTGPHAVLFHLASMALTIAIVRAGIRGGIERASRLLMPILFVLLIGLAVWAATLSGAGAGYAYYLRPHPGALLDPTVLTGAAGQAFFSLSLGVGGIMTLASYLEHDETSLPGQAATVAFADTVVAIVGGLVTFPVIYHLGLQQEVGASPIGALFITLPSAFHTIGAGGVIVGTVFFVALYIAALTSAIALLEVVVSGLIDGWGWTRSRATLAAGGTIAVLGLPGALSLNWLAFVDKMVGEVFLLIGGLATAVLTGWVWSAGAEAELARGFRWPALIRAWIWLLRTVIPVVVAVMLYLTVGQAIPVARALFR